MRFEAGFFAYNLYRVNLVEFIINRAVGNYSPSGDNLACPFSLSDLFWF